MLDLKNDKTWESIRSWFVVLACVGTYFIGMGLTTALYEAHLSVKAIAGNSHIAAGIFWPILLPAGFALWYPVISFIVFTSVLACVSLVLLRVRRYQLQVAKTETILCEDETLITKLPCRTVSPSETY